MTLQTLLVSKARCEETARFWKTFFTLIEVTNMKNVMKRLYVHVKESFCRRQVFPRFSKIHPQLVL